MSTASTVRQAMPGERIVTLDVLRGYALLAMLIVHMTDFATPSPRALQDGVDFLIENKGLSLFAFLFGTGFAIQLTRAVSAGRSIVPRYLRRMLVLFAIGAAHWCLVWGSYDILQTYALLGCVLLLFRNARPGLVLVSAVLLLFLPFARQPLTRALDSVAGPHGDQQKIEVAKARSLRERLETARRSGNYGTLVRTQSGEFVRTYTHIFIVYRKLMAGFFALFLFGLYAVRKGLVHHLPDQAPLLRTLMWLGLVIGLATNYIWKFGGPVSQSANIRLAAEIISGPSLALFYACALALLMQNNTWQKWIGVLQWPGRTAMTNYVAQTIIVTSIYYGWGFGLMKQLTTLQAFAAAILIFTLLAAASFAWLRFFQFGPLEWFWRSLAQARFQPFRIPADTERSLSVSRPS